MPLESTMICLDNSDWMRNGDFTPSRLDAQQDAASMVCNDRLNSNPENTVGILTMGGQGVDMLVSPTEEVGKVLACFAKVKMGGKGDLVTAIQIAQLALKHRKNKNGGQRIIVFVGSPIADTPEVLAKVGKQLKKNNVAIDIISIGEGSENTPKLQELINAANTNDNSHLISVSAGTSPVNALISSPIMYGGASLGGFGGGNVAPGAGNDNFDMYGGIDPALDPELAMAIRVSIEEGRAAEEARLKQLQEQEGGATKGPSTTAVEEDDEEAMMRRALEMSLQDAGVSTSSQNQNNQSSAMEVANSGGDEYDEDEELQRALALSMQQTAAPQPVVTSNNNNNNNTQISNTDLVNQLLSTADPNDPLVQAALAQLQQQNKDSDKDGDKSRKRKNEE